MKDLKKINKAINFIEELDWLIEGSSISLKEIPVLLRMLLNSAENFSSISNLNEKTNRNKLIGILPNLFQDRGLFGRNLDLAEFAKDLLGIEVLHAKKRSRNEIIGLIVCEITELPEDKLENLVQFLSDISENEMQLMKIKDAKKSANFSWNKALQELSKS